MRTIAGRYVLEGRLGAGGMGEVYRARHLQLGKHFALKVIAPAFAADAPMRALFEREVKLASEINHPNIVSVVDYGEDPELGAFMVMELVQGVPLVAEQLSAPMPPRRALDILGQVADALDHIHKCGILHGDIKADNIMIVNEPEHGTTARRRRLVQLLDFGLARRVGLDDEGVSGSPHYLAPERALGGPTTVATDIYALGIVGFLLFTNSLPFDGELRDLMTAHVEEPMPTLAERRGEPVDAAIETLIARATAKDPAARHPSAAAFVYELKTVMDMLDVGRRRVRSSGTQRSVEPQEIAITQLFEQSPFAQALVSTDGVILVANRAFAEMSGILGDPVGHWLAEAHLAHVFKNLMRTIERAPMVGRPVERRAELATGDEIVLWAGPTQEPGRVHLVLRLAPSRSAAGYRDSSELIPRS